MFIVIIFSFMHFFIVFFIFFLDTDHAKSQAVEPHVSDHRKKKNHAQTDYIHHDSSNGGYLIA